MSLMEKHIIASPSVNLAAMDELLDNMYITNVAKRLRELNSPTEIDKKRWLWELIQNAKDTIAKDPNRNKIDIRIEIKGDVVKFKHNGAPFTPKTRLGLLYKYSGGKENQESTGRFGTGFLTTHCLSKTVTIESNQYADNGDLCGFKVTMYRDGLVESEFIEGLRKMRDSEEFYKELFDWTTFTYDVKTDSGRSAIRLGVENFYENIAQTMLFCSELNSVVLDDNGSLTEVVRLPVVSVTEGVTLAEFEIRRHSGSYKRRFLITHYEELSKELSDRYKSNRVMRLDVVIEIDENNNIVNHDGKTSHFCVFPLVGIESQVCEPVIINSPDFEPDTERQSLLLSGQVWNEEKNVITETGINHLIYEQIFPLYERLVAYLSEAKYGSMYNLASGLLRAKAHEKLDKEWYTENVIKKYRSVLLKYAVVKPYEGETYKKLTDCIIVKETKVEDEKAVYELISSLYPTTLVAENHEWAKVLWKDGLRVWTTEDLCADIESKRDWNCIEITDGIHLSVWYNKFLMHVSKYDIRLLTDKALLPNMNGALLKRDAEDFRQGQNVSAFVVNLLAELGKDVKPMLLHNDITAVKLEEKYNFQSYCADINRLVKKIIDDAGEDKLSRLMPVLSIIPDNQEKYSEDFINRRKNFFEIGASLFSLSDDKEIVNNDLLDVAWKELDTWFVPFVLEQLNSIGSLSEMPSGLDAKWINSTLSAFVEYGVQTKDLDNYKVLPNQAGTFCNRKNLYEDAGIPDELKDSIFDDVDIKYKQLLLDKNIDADLFGINQKKDVSAFASELKSKFEPAKSWSSGHNFRGCYHYYPKDILDEIALYIVSILPQDTQSELYERQNTLYSISKSFLPSNQTYDTKSIDLDSSDLWKSANTYVCDQICEAISAAKSLDGVNDLLENVGIKKVWNILNNFYNLLKQEGIQYNNRPIFPNQNGSFKQYDELCQDYGNIGDILKDVISKLVDEDSEYRNILMDTECVLQPKEKLAAEDAYKLIDDTIFSKYSDKSNWQDQSFVEAVHKLMEEWAETAGSQFKVDYFPKIKPIESDIVLNVVWTKEKREQMMSFGAKYKDIAENPEKYKNLEQENNSLREENERLKRMLYGANNGSGVIEWPIQYAGSYSEPQYGGLSEQEMHDALIEAKEAVRQHLERKGYRFTQGICENAWCNIYGVISPEGKETPLVVHSYKDRTRLFALNASDWEQLSQDGAMLWVVTSDGPQCVPFFALPSNDSTICITFSAENMQYKDRCVVLAETLRYFKGLQFQLGSNIIRDSRPQLFNSPTDKSEPVIESMRKMFGKPEQSENKPVAGANENALL